MTLPSPRRTRRVWGIGRAEYNVAYENRTSAVSASLSAKRRSAVPSSGSSAFAFRESGSNGAGRARPSDRARSIFHVPATKPSTRNVAGTWRFFVASRGAVLVGDHRGSDRRARAPGCRSRAGTAPAPACRPADEAPWAGRTARGPSRRGRRLQLRAQRLEGVASPRSPDQVCASRDARGAERRRGSAARARRRRAPCAHRRAEPRLRQRELQAVPGHPQRVIGRHLHSGRCMRTA